MDDRLDLRELQSVADSSPESVLIFRKGLPETEAGAESSESTSITLSTSEVVVKIVFADWPPDR